MTYKELFYSLLLILSTILVVLTVMTVDANSTNGLGFIDSILFDNKDQVLQYKGKP